MSLIAVFTTLPTREQARDLAHSLVEQGLVACAQISAIESIYRWQGAIQQEGEFRLMLKACASRYAEIEAAILACHPYALPAIHALAIEQVHGPYADWIAAAAGEDAGFAGPEAAPEADPSAAAS